MRVQYALMDPTGNMTVLVETPVPTALHAAAASRLMAMEPDAEQVGFLSRDLVLRMAGGEFCGNASMSAAVLHCIRMGLPGGLFRLRVSGAREPVNVEAQAESGGLWRGAVDMPRPVSLEEIRLDGGPAVPVAAFEGISHVILDRELPKDQAEALAKRWCGALGADALGLMFLDRAGNRLTPLVYVPAANTLFWESACGSGTAAVGAWIARASGGPVHLSLTQPGGVLQVSAVPDGPIRLRGTVRMVLERTVEIDL